MNFRLAEVSQRSGLDEASLKFRSDALGYSADFRTTLAKLEPVPLQKGLKYKARIDRIEFGQGYRILSAKFLDAGGKVVPSVEFGSDDPWKLSFGDTAGEMARVIRN